MRSQSQSQSQPQSQSLSLSLWLVPLSKGVLRGDDVQIVRTKDEPQLVVARSPLHSLQYPVLYLSRMQRICPTRYLNLRSSLTELQLRGDQGHAHVMILVQPEDWPILIHYNNE